MSARDENKKLRKALTGIIESGRKVRSDDSGTAYYAIGKMLAEAGIALGIPLEDVFAKTPAEQPNGVEQKEGT